MHTITPHLWFDKEAREAAELYTSIFKDSKIKSMATLHSTPSGTVELLTIQLLGQEFRFISAGPLFKFTPAVSFLVACDAKDEVDTLWNELSKGGSALMELGEYPFSERYGWTQDRYGLSWQVMLMGERKVEQKITPTLMFVPRKKEPLSMPAFRLKARASRSWTALVRITLLSTKRFRS
jgi:predicted 3-demethylubiquinone-9 3-methyltransferase (glyoxalase superfamily)